MIPSPRFRDLLPVLIGLVVGAGVMCVIFVLLLNGIFK